jgi:hypothetical protein
LAKAYSEVRLACTLSAVKLANVAFLFAHTFGRSWKGHAFQNSLQQEARSHHQPMSRLNRSTRSSQLTPIVRQMPLMPKRGTLHRLFSSLPVQVFPVPRIGATKLGGAAIAEVVHASSASRTGLVSMMNRCLGDFVLAVIVSWSGDMRVR